MRETNSRDTQIHPYQPYVPDAARYLILGSVPPWRFCLEGEKPLREKDVDFYYGSYDRGYNLFWEVLLRGFETALLPDLERIRSLQTEREERTDLQRGFFREFLSRHDLGMADILLRFERRDRSAADGKIRPLEYTDLLGILASRPRIESIFCTSRHKVFLWLGQYLGSQGIHLEYAADKSGALFSLPASAGRGREIRIIVLPSPSPIGRIRFPNHQCFVEHLIEEYRRLFGLV